MTPPKKFLSKKPLVEQLVSRPEWLLVVEKDYRGTPQQEGGEEILQKVMNPHNTFSYIKDAVDEVIEKVLENGGDVEFVEEGLLKEFRQIALIQFY